MSNELNKLIEELEIYKKLNKTIDIDFLIILLKIHFKN